MNVEKSSENGRVLTKNFDFLFGKIAKKLSFFSDLVTLFKLSGKIYVVARFKPSGNIIMTPPGERETFNRNVLVRKAGSR